MNRKERAGLALKVVEAAAYTGRLERLVEQAGDLLKLWPEGDALQAKATEWCARAFDTQVEGPRWGETADADGEPHCTCGVFFDTRKVHSPTCQLTIWERQELR